MTTVQNGAEMRANIYKVAATWLALGLNPEESLFYKQSDIPEIFELSWALSCFTPKGFMNRAHAYKAKLEANTAAGVDVDSNVNMGLYCYPCLMDADILMFSADIVPVGKTRNSTWNSLAILPSSSTSILAKTCSPCRNRFSRNPLVSSRVSTAVR